MKKYVVEMRSSILRRVRWSDGNRLCGAARGEGGERVVSVGSAQLSYVFISPFVGVWGVVDARRYWAREINSPF